MPLTSEKSKGGWVIVLLFTDIVQGRLRFSGSLAMLGMCRRGRCSRSSSGWG
jgi:hypothetical protein